MPKQQFSTNEIMEAGWRRFGGRVVSCAFCDRDTSGEAGRGDVVAEWEAAWLVNEVANLLPEVTAEHPACPGCTILSLAEALASGQLSITRPRI
jgi:hypothetical protein